MKKTKRVEKKIEETRHEMMAAYEKFGSFTDKRVVAISQELDQLMNQQCPEAIESCLE
ncbi:aspartyl-phosphate phosphatase Spo0E family protein [Alteribacillus iranensis]|uniref:Spo0E like sporulation regulatory protein n=1 Tax=Alteribacillus iranensis TaxID=930128 RepID=A0A1I2BRE8_9BACI|nr:aspartyl-phosphate phosphatase Spo0E family protein [Alteribacillus iranensis]SFE58418.1 Spo0E like sporulation regulatory protein [Alteribacillus iranensis]